MNPKTTETNAQPSASQTQENPAVKRGAHKADCMCGFCVVRRRNLAKKKDLAQSQPAQGAQASASASVSGSGDASGPSSPPKSSPASQPSMSGKLATMEKEKAASAKSAKTENVTGKGSNATQQPKKEMGWFEKLFSGATFFEG